MAKSYFVFNSFKEPVSISEYSFLDLLAKHSDDVVIKHSDPKYDDLTRPFIDHIDFYYVKGHEGIPFVSSVEREYLV